jgi:hypothetical protein
MVFKLERAGEPLTPEERKQQDKKRRETEAQAAVGKLRCFLRKPDSGGGFEIILIDRRHRPKPGVVVASFLSLDEVERWLRLPKRRQSPKANTREPAVTVEVGGGDDGKCEPPVRPRSSADPITGRDKGAI